MNEKNFDGGLSDIEKNLIEALTKKGFPKKQIFLASTPSNKGYFYDLWMKHNE